MTPEQDHRSASVEWARADCLLPDCGWRYRGDDAVDVADDHHAETGHPTEAKEHVVVVNGSAA